MSRISGATGGISIIWISMGKNREELWYRIWEIYKYSATAFWTQILIISLPPRDIDAKIVSSDPISLFFQYVFMDWGSTIVTTSLQHLVECLPSFLAVLAGSATVAFHSIVIQSIQRISLRVALARLRREINSDQISLAISSR